MSQTWTSRVSGDRKRVLFLGPEGRLDSRVVEGGELKGEVLRAVLSLEMPSLTRMVLKGGTVTVRGLDLTLQAQGRPKTTLRFRDVESIPPALVRDLKDTYERKRPAGALSREVSESRSLAGKASVAARRARRSRWLDNEQSENQSAPQMEQEEAS